MKKKVVPCKKCGGATKMKKGGESGGARSAKALMENMGTSGQYGKMKKGGSVKRKKSVKSSGKIVKAQKGIVKGGGPDISPIHVYGTPPKGKAAKVVYAAKVAALKKSMGI